jgi:hypothetical protein
MSWKALEDGNKELAEYGAKRFASNHVGYLATIRKDGSPRVHPMTPFVLHCSVEDQDGGEGEFFVRGRATLTDDADMWAIAEKYVPYSDREDDYVLFEFSVESAFGRVYDGMLKRWK